MFLKKQPSIKWQLFIKIIWTAKDYSKDELKKKKEKKN